MDTGFYSDAVTANQDRFDTIHLFQSFIRDATITIKDYDEAFFDFSNYEFGTQYTIGLQAGFVGELGYKSKLNYSLLSVGADYLRAKNHIRGVIGIGLDEGAPDFKIQVGYIFSFQKSSN